MLGELIEWLEKQDPKREVVCGFGAPMSYRGYYDQVAFAPVDKTTFGEMLQHAKAALGATFIGYKGGEYTMHEYTDCWIAEYGETGGDCIGPNMMRLWLRCAA